ncbi:unnamed protein product [Nesidiocoris tenuis]|uniref:Uncharacterized protein n=2 Tax=Nesidiocoris tenuis TaxID=355587 RepID=A0A6H5GET5_9HEMI|nr:Hypothetical protein NTJ_09903 [Nesidiocoris tenuis]CAB0001498.1 unnamed protein product [Nesidiocoris tenuis]
MEITEPSLPWKFLIRAAVHLSTPLIPRSTCLRRLISNRTPRILETPLGGGDSSGVPRDSHSGRVKAAARIRAPVPPLAGVRLPLCFYFHPNQRHGGGGSPARQID